MAIPHRRKRDSIKTLSQKGDPSLHLLQVGCPVLSLGEIQVLAFGLFNLKKLHKTPRGKRRYTGEPKVGCFSWLTKKTTPVTHL